MLICLMLSKSGDVLIKTSTVFYVSTTKICSCYCAWKKEKCQQTSMCFCSLEYWCSHFLLYIPPTWHSPKYTTALFHLEDTRSPNQPLLAVAADLASASRIDRLKL